MRARNLCAITALALAACGDDAAPPADTPDGASDACPPAETAVANESWRHVAEESEVEYGHNPPASGAHYPVWAPYQAYTTPVPRGYWVHNLEHGAVVLLYRADAPAEIIDQLTAVYADIPDDATCGHTRSVLTPDPLLDDVVAVAAADVVLEGACVDRDVILGFVDAHRGHGPEDVCAQGAF